jgi:uncharacterized protein YndB with AHSA1/START domain
MARTEIDVDVPPERVWAVLADAQRYPDWVVGADRIRDADPGFPAIGTRFHHRVGFGPLKIDDHTEVVEAVAPVHLRLKAKARPFGTAFVDLRLARNGRGFTHVTMREGPADLLSRLAHNPLTDLLLHGRNVESLRRLKRVSEASATGAGGGR